MRLLAAALLSLVIASGVPVALRAQTPSAITSDRARAQQPRFLSFNAEGNSFPHPVQLPEAVLNIVLKDSDDFPDGPPKGVHCNDKETFTAEWLPQLLCTKVPLSSTKGTSYLVIGVGSLRGAHVVPFWLLHEDARGASLLFKARSDGITLEMHSFQHYRIVEATWVSMAGANIFTSRFHFTGKFYEKFSESDRHTP